jgi:glycosyltransferase involved in cell wall biosynthesis
LPATGASYCPTIDQHMAWHFRAFDVFVSAARSEPFGLAIVEAMATRRPLILARTMGPAEFATDPRIRWSAPDDDGDLAAGLREACARGRHSVAYD